MHTSAETTDVVLSDTLHSCLVMCIVEFGPGRMVLCMRNIRLCSGKFAASGPALLACCAAQHVGPNLVSRPTGGLTWLAEPA
jgi:hypothetical protein